MVDIHPGNHEVGLMCEEVGVRAASDKWSVLINHVQIRQDNPLVLYDALCYE